MMNERIKELERQAFDAVWDLDKDLIGPGTHFRPNGFEQKFAELIVLECANEIRKWNSEPFPYDPEFGAKLIKEHFGVEE